jgi:hypothetical protein
MATKQRSVNRPNMLSYVKAFEILLSGHAFTREELVEATGWHYMTAGRFIKALRDYKLIHVSAWLPDTMDRDSIAVYARGNKKDKARKKLTTAQRTKRWRDNQRKLRQQRNIEELMK